MAQQESRSVGRGGATSSQWETEVLDRLSDGVPVVDEAGLIVYANRQAERLTRYRRGELLRRPVELLVPASLRAVHREERRALMRYADLALYTAKRQGGGLASVAHRVPSGGRPR